MCACGAKPLVVQYVPVRKPTHRHYYLACSKCDLIALWPNFCRSSPVVSKE